LSETYGNCAVIDHREPLDIRLQCVGQPLPGVTARICDMETGLTLPDEVVGEIRVKGPLFKSYFKEPEKTQASYDSEGYFCTGDLGMLDKQGRLYYKGRLKEMVKSGGINIAPIEVEEVLMRHPALKSAYVIGMPDPHLDEILVALLVAKEGQTVTHEALKAFCKKELAAYKVPAKFQWVNEQDLPLTSTGKLQKMMLNKLVKS
jgi:fatty-acyl-CoA synthase